MAAATAGSPPHVSGYVRPPREWHRVKTEGPWPFTTRETFRGPGGVEIGWESRQHRKGSPDAGRHPSRREWWMAALFAIGSVLFTLGAVASQWGLGVAAHDTAVVFFVGSLFFTAAAAIQWNEAVNADRGVGEPPGFSRWRPASWEPKRIDWLATLVQLIGTVLFNVSTGLALGRHLTAGQADLRVWAPDIFGSIAFLVSSQLALAEVCHRWLCLRPRSLPWQIVALNLLGSVAFGVSAVASLVEPSSGAPLSAAVSNAGTYVGGFLFLLGAVLLVPEARGHRETRARHMARAANARVGSPPGSQGIASATR